MNPALAQIIQVACMFIGAIVFVAVFGAVGQVWSNRIRQKRHDQKTKPS
ncbi:hypothetical protein HA050_11700 [Iodobacter sp. HSC-16F04]|uniref:Uncharacterized protein n=1 Tax=Iodobacter violaceini TaxID=3044271 RepID=A0ABX0KWC9_9NEIS|nr:hypothetical protein [Iodobacter violacea]NHQ86782.1 hypothetical protein [Iodobacter violacea]